jgi:phospholipid/cholesterol/gamma-HCH transport system ATP-binding protein
MSDNGNGKCAIEFIGVCKRFGGNVVLDGVDLAIPEGKISMIMGPSGTGKSVCINHMLGLMDPDEGDVKIFGESVPEMPRDDLRELRKRFGVLFQNGGLISSYNLYDNIAFPLRHWTDKSDEEIDEIVHKRLKEVGLAEEMQKMPVELSGGMRKRAGFARALALEPEIVVFDEPDSGLDPVRVSLLDELIQDLHDSNGGTYVIVSHDIRSADHIADYIALLWKGKIVEAGEHDEMFDSDDRFVHQFMCGEAQGPLGME